MNFTTLEKTFNSGWTSAFARESIQSFKKVGLPHSKLEPWRYTPIAKEFDSFDFAAGSLRESKKFKNRLYFQNGRFNFEASSIPEGVEIKPISELSEMEFISFIQAIPARENPLLSLGAASLSGACFIKITKNLKGPLTIIFEAFENEKISQPIILVETSKNISATLFEKHISDCIHFENRTLKMSVSEGSHITHLISTVLGNETIFNTNTHVDVKKDATYTNFLITLAGKMVRHNLDIRLSEHGAHTSSFGLYALNNKEHVDNYTFIDHACEETTSEQLFKGILDNQSKGIFTGKIHVAKNSQRINSSQLNKTLLLTKTAQSHSQPQLEIFADDVKCSHGSTTGQLNPEEVFYFQSRGISEKKAKILLSQAFVNDILLKIKDKTLTQELSEYCFDKFSQLDLGVI